MSEATPLISEGLLGLAQREDLRRVDWRFLLPAPPQDTFHHLLLLGATESSARILEALGLAQQVSYDLTTGAAFDAVAVLSGAHTSLQDAVARLAPGGVLYYEFARRVTTFAATAPGRVKRALRTMGVTSADFYAVSPNFQRCEMYLPLEVPGALAWYVKSLYMASTPRQRLFELMLRAMTGYNSARFAPFAPYYAVVAVAPPAADLTPSMLDHQALPTALSGERLYPLLLNDAGNRVTLLPFRQAGHQPITVLKVPKLASFNGRTENEQATLLTIRDKLNAALCRRLPQPLGVIQHKGISIGVESYIPGQSFLRSSGRWGKPVASKLDDLRLATDWLIEFHKQAEVSRPPWGDAEIARWLKDPIDEYRARFGSSDVEEHLFGRTIECAQTLVDVSLPIVYLHRDFNVWNLYRDGGHLNVIDWEGGRPGPALCDLLHFVTHWNETVRHLTDDEAKLRAFDRLFIEPDPDDMPTRVIYEAIRRYMEQLEIDAGFLPLMLVYTWLELALRRDQQQRDMGEQRTDARSGNRNFAYVEMLAKHTEELFIGCGHG